MNTAGALLAAQFLSLLATSIFNPRSSGRSDVGRRTAQTQFSNDATVPRSRRHLASFAASIAAHAAIVAMIVCFASPLARGHSEWVLAYLVEGADGSSGRGGAERRRVPMLREHAASVTPAATRIPRRRKAARQAASSSRRRARRRRQRGADASGRARATGRIDA